MHIRTMLGLSLIGTALLSASGTGNTTYSPWQNADAMVDQGIDPNCTLLPEDCPRNWLWPATNQVISCAPGATGYRAPRWQGLNQYFCCNGQGRWRYVYLNLQTSGIEVDCK